MELIKGTPIFEYFYDEETDDETRMETMLNSKARSLSKQKNVSHVNSEPVPKAFPRAAPLIF